MPEIRIRALKNFEELSGCVELQKKIWGPRFDDIVSAALMRVSQKIGGIASGAFNDTGTLIGIVFGLTGIRDDRRVHWSHMLAVTPEYQGQGLGRLMKLYQRERVLRLGIETMYWTFDPLEARNAHFNFNVLNVRFDEYVVDMYGSGESSPLHRGLGTDRFVVRWELNDTPFPQESGALDWADEEAIAELPLAPPVERGRDSLPSSSTAQASPNPKVVEIPPNIQALKASNPEEAGAWRTATRAAFTQHLSEGRTVVGFTRSRETGTFVYVLESA